MGSITSSGSLTFASFTGPIILTGVATTSSLLVALIIFFYKNKQEEHRNGDLEQNLSQEENNGGADEKQQSPEETGAQGKHDRNPQASKVMRNGSLIFHRGERTPGPQVVPVSSSARF